MAADSVSVPAPDFVKVPAPLITPPYVTSLERLNVTPPVTAMVVVAIEPVVEPEPIDTVPAETVNGPTKELAPVRLSVPDPALVSPPELDEVVPLNVVEASLPPDVSVALKVIAPEPASEPTVSALPPMSSVPLTVRADVSGMTAAAPRMTVPAEIVVTPPYVLAPDNVSEPAPVLVSDVAEVPIAPLINEVPADSTVSAFPPVIAPDIVNEVPVST